MTALMVICMYCKKEMDKEDGDGIEGDTGSICEECWEKRFPGVPYPVEEKRRSQVSSKSTDTRIPLGQLLMTRGVNDRVADDTEFAKFVTESLKRHAKGDWGDMGQEDKQENDFSLKKGFRLLSAYERNDLPKIWIITEADRSVTTVLFPDEY